MEYIKFDSTPRGIFEEFLFNRPEVYINRHLEHLKMGHLNIIGRIKIDHKNQRVEYEIVDETVSYNDANK